MDWSSLEALEEILKDKTSSIGKIVDLLPKQIAFGVLQACINTRPTYLLRALHPDDSEDFAKGFDAVMDGAEYAKILRGLPIKRGGLSLARCETIAKPAYAASFLGSLKSSWIS